MNVADLSDAYSDTLQYVEPNLFRNYGGKTKFGGMISTLKVHEDNLLVKQALNEPGNKRVRKNGTYTRKGKPGCDAVQSFHVYLESSLALSSVIV